MFTAPIGSDYTQLFYYSPLSNGGPAIRYSNTDLEAMSVIGMRLRNTRLSQNRSISEMVSLSGLDRKTIMSIEAGRDVRLSKLIRYLRALGIMHNLEAAFPDELPGTLGITKRGQVRKKAAPSRKAGQPKK